MKNLSLPLLAIFVGLFPVPATADDELAKLAPAGREAALMLSIDLSPTEQGHSFGAFISDDGLALVSMATLCGTQKPRVTTADGPLKFGTILGFLPEQDLALMKFAHRPKGWLRLAAKEPAAGENLSLVIINPKKLMDLKVPPITGPVMAKRSTWTSNLREAKFTSVLSLGAGTSPEQRNYLSNGCFTLNSKGELAAFFFEVEPGKGQTFIHLIPVSTLTERVNELSRGNAALPFPVPKAQNPRDRASLDGDWRPMMVAILRKDRAVARTAYQKLAKRNPKVFNSGPCT